MNNLFSVIIPAHNEESLITSTISYLLSDNALSHCELIIVCNGCFDNTELLVNQFIKDKQSVFFERYINIIVLNTPIASKTHALNLGVKESRYEYIVFLDADILISGKDLIELNHEVEKGLWLAISPKINFVFQDSDFWVKQYFNLVKNSIYNVNHRLSNVIAFSPEGIKKIGILPHIIADDEYIRRKLSYGEYNIIDGLSFDFICPKTLSSLLQVLTRVERGNLQLKHLKIYANASTNTQGFEKMVWTSLPIFYVSKLFSLLRAKLQFKFGNITQWERDESNR